MTINRCQGWLGLGSSEKGPGAKYKWEGINPAGGRGKATYAPRGAATSVAEPLNRRSYTL